MIDLHVVVENLFKIWWSKKIWLNFIVWASFPVIVKSKTKHVPGYLSLCVTLTGIFSKDTLQLTSPSSTNEALYSNKERDTLQDIGN